MTDYSDIPAESVIILKLRDELALLTGEPWEATGDYARLNTLKPAPTSPARLFFRHGYGARSNRLEVSGSVDMRLGSSGGRLYGVKYPSATFDKRREPAAIAKEIVRRVLPDLRALVAAYEDAAREERERASAVDVNVAKLVAAAPSILRKSEHNMRHGSATLYTYDACSYGSFTVSEESVKAELAGLPVALAVEIAQLLEEYALEMKKETAA